MTKKKRLTKEDILKIAKLVNIDAESESDYYISILGQTLDYIDKLEELDVSKVKETFQVTGLTNVFKNDKENLATLTQIEALQNSTETVRNLFSTGAVINK